MVEVHTFSIIVTWTDPSNFDSDRKDVGQCDTEWPQEWKICDDLKTETELAITYIEVYFCMFVHFFMTETNKMGDSSYKVKSLFQFH